VSQTEEELNVNNISVNNINENNDSKDQINAVDQSNEGSLSDLNSYHIHSAIFKEEEEIEMEKTKPEDILIVFIDDESSLLELYNIIMKKLSMYH